MAKARHERRRWWALAASLLLHALLLLVAASGAQAPRPVEHSSAPIELDLVTLAPPPPVAPAAQPAPAPAKKASASAPAPQQQAQSGGTLGAAAVAPAGAGPRQAADAPRAARLEPSLGVVLPGLGEGERELSRGRTVVNGPGEEPDAVAVRDYTQDLIKRRLDQDLANGAAAARLRSGLMDPYFTQLGRKLADGLGAAGVDLRQRSTGEILREEVFGTWQDAAGRYGKDGNPLGSKAEERAVMDTGLGRGVEGQSPALGDLGFQRESAKALQQLGSMEALVAAAQRARLRTVIELRQDRSGALSEALFLEKSGDDKFDEFVLHQARKVVREQGEVEEGEPPYKEGWRTVWQFTWEPPKVRAKLLRVLKGLPDDPFLVPRP